MGANVLVVEDDGLTADSLRRVLVDLGYRVSAVAANGSDALQAADDLRPDLVLMDIGLDGSLDGIDTAAEIQSRYHLPVVYVSGRCDEATLARAKETRPYGFLVKPFTGRDLRVSIEVALSAHEARSELAATASRLAAENDVLVAKSTALERESERLLAAARTDPLTEAANRRHLQDDLEAIAGRARRYGHRYCAAICDIDDFKGYNDRFGHLAGDGALRLVCQAIQQHLRRGDGFYRYGGDEFLVLLPEQSIAGARECMERVREKVAAIPVAEEGGSLARKVTVSIGIAEFRGAPEGDAVRSWLRRADAALYRAKAGGRNRVEVDA